MRQESLTAGGTFGFTSARSLLAILRLSQALARLRCSNEVRSKSSPTSSTLTLVIGGLVSQVNREDIVEARRLMSLSRASIIEAGGEEGGVERRKDDPTSVVYNLIRQHANDTGKVTVSIPQVLPMVLAKGYTRSHLDECLQEYEDISVWQVGCGNFLTSWLGEVNSRRRALFGR